MGSYYETVSTGGDSSAGPQWATIHLYPYSTVTGTCQSGGLVVSALETAFDDLVNYGAIDYYEVLRFKTESYENPDHVDGEEGTESTFRDYLQGSNSDPDHNNGTGENLYSRVGVHHLAHTGQNACDEDSEGYAPAGANAEGQSDSAFVDPLLSWAPICNYNDSLTKNAAVQEPLHQFIKDSEDTPYTGVEDDEHSLGKVTLFNSTGYVTPMLTYHWDDPKPGEGKDGQSEVGEGECPSDTENRYASSHFQTPTACTKKAVRDTADADVNSSL